MTIHCIIVDDEPIAHQIIEKYLAEFSFLTISGSFYNAVDARNFLEKNKVDLLFLDISMPGEDGLGFLKMLPKKPVTILVTALLDHALEAYDLDVIDYLVKPIRPERFKKALDKAVDFLQVHNQEFLLASQNRGSRLMTIKSGREKIQINTDNISHIQSLKDYMLIYTPDRKHIVRSTATKMLEMLPKEFVRVHKSFIVNKEKIKRIASNRVEMEGYVIPLGKNFKHSL